MIRKVTCLVKNGQRDAAKRKFVFETQFLNDSAWRAIAASGKHSAAGVTQQQLGIPGDPVDVNSSQERRPRPPRPIFCRGGSRVGIHSFRKGDAWLPVAMLKGHRSERQILDA